jgi:hypothetical protein
MAFKPLEILWSQAAIDRAGPRIVELQAKLIRELHDFLDGAAGNFLHVFDQEPDHSILMCQGDDSGGGWRIFVQIGEYEPMKPLPVDHPDPERRGKVFKMPVVVEEAQNEIFCRLDEPNSYN